MDKDKQIRDVLEELRVSLQADGGDLEVASIDGNEVKLKLTGACGGCPHAMITLKEGIERVLRDRVDSDIVVERA